MSDDEGRPGTKVRCTDLETGDYEESTILNDYIVVCDGNRFVQTIQTYANGTAVITIKRLAPVVVGSDDASSSREISEISEAGDV